MKTSPRLVRILRRGDLADDGLGSRALRAEVAARRLLVVRPGVYVWADDVADLSPEGRVVIRARALALVSAVRPVFADVTAGALHGLPLYGSATRGVHVVARSGRPSGGVGVVRHDGDLADDDVVEIDGLLCTSLARTVADVARSASFVTAVCLADAALRSVAHLRHGDYLLDRAEEFRETAREISAQFTRGSKKAERVLSFADGRADLPGESVSRIHLRDLGFARPDLQVRIPGPRSSHYFVDFGLHDVHALGEFDGAGKYTDPAMLGGRTPAKALDDEKQREDWIRGKYDGRFARWGSVHIRSALTLGDRLAAFGIVPPHPPRRG